MISNKKDVALIPWDFTEVAEYALQYALIIHKSTRTDLALVHIVKHEKDVQEAKTKLETVASDIKKKHNIAVQTFVREGTIFTSISDVASEVEANLVIMGTHGIKGMQKLTGSWALKVIVSSDIPFIAVQAPPQKNTLSNIVFPVDFRRETREMLNWVNYLSKYYKVKIHLFKKSDPSLRKKVEGNVMFTKKYLQQHNIDYDITTDKGKDSFPIETINFAKEINADVILVMTSKNLGFANFVMGPDEQYIIANSAKIPVMCINPRPVSITGSFSAGGG